MIDLLALLKRLEHHISGPGKVAYCPICSLLEGSGHLPDCQLKAAIDWLEDNKESIIDFHQWITRISEARKLDAQESANPLLKFARFTSPLTATNGQITAQDLLDHRAKMMKAIEDSGGPRSLP